MKQFKVVILLISVSILLCACPDRGGHQYITIANRSDQMIIFQPRIFKINEVDTLYDCHYVNFNVSFDSIYKFRYDARYTWEVGLDANWYLQLILMNGNTYFKYATPFNCDTIRKYVPILYRYRLKLEDLQRMNWTVVYPPEE